MEIRRKFTAVSLPLNCRDTETDKLRYYSQLYLFLNFMKAVFKLRPIHLCPTYHVSFEDEVMMMKMIVIVVVVAAVAVLVCHKRKNLTPPMTKLAIRHAPHIVSSIVHPQTLSPPSLMLSSQFFLGIAVRLLQAVWLLRFCVQSSWPKVSSNIL